MECSCGSEYERIAQHWAFNPSHRPELSQRQYELCSGMLLGDGCIVNDAQEAALVVEMKNREFIDWLDEELGWLSNGYTEKKDELARLRTLAHPELTELRGWYWAGEKVFPQQLELTSTMFEMWYVSDGTLERRDGRKPRMRLSTTQMQEHVDSILSTVPFNLEYTWNVSEGLWGTSAAVVFSTETTWRLQRNMNERPKGFAHKYMDEEELK